MRQTYSSFLKRITILSSIVLALIIIVYYLLPTNYFIFYNFLMVPFFMIITAGFYYLLLKSSETKFSRFVNSFMLLTFAKLIFYLIILFILAYTNKQYAITIILTYFILYLTYTIFEVLSFLNALKKTSKNL